MRSFSELYRKNSRKWQRRRRRRGRRGFRSPPASARPRWRQTPQCPYRHPRPRRHRKPASGGLRHPRRWAQGRRGHKDPDRGLQYVRARARLPLLQPLRARGARTHRRSVGGSASWRTTVLAVGARGRGLRMGWGRRGHLGWGSLGRVCRDRRRNREPYVFVDSLLLSLLKTPSFLTLFLKETSAHLLSMNGIPQQQPTPQGV